MTEHHYEARLEHDLSDIKTQVAEIAEAVSNALRRAVEALEHRDHRLAYRTIIYDNPINRAVEDCDRSCHYFVARHLPTAGHLRFISSVMRLNVALERVGDYATTISRVSVQLHEQIKPGLLDRIKAISDGSAEMFGQAVSAFIDGNAELARGTIAFEEQIDRSFQAALNHLVKKDATTEAERGDLLGKLIILSMLERISDQAKNICEYAIFAATGETKRRKPVPVLFVDRDNSVLGPMARAAAERAYPAHGVYATAGFSASDSLDPVFVAEMTNLGYDLSSVTPTALSDHPDIGAYKVVVILEGNARDYFVSVPFNTAVVEWDLPHRSEPLNDLHTKVLGLIEDLMVTLRGEQPDSDVERG